MLKQKDEILMRFELDNQSGMLRAAVDEFLVKVRAA
jgi:hypothetical protein